MTMISVLIQTESHFPINKNRVKEAVVSALKDTVKRDTEVSISIVGDRQMRHLNRTYRKIDDTTDVLSFPLNEATYGGKPFVDAPDGTLRLGDIIISYPQAVVEASEENTLVDDKLEQLVLHGLNHLMGIHHPE